MDHIMFGIPLHLLFVSSVIVTLRNDPYVIDMLLNISYAIDML